MVGHSFVKSPKNRFRDKYFGRENQETVLGNAVAVIGAVVAHTITTPENHRF
jgi:hypothetical protein